MTEFDVEVTFTVTAETAREAEHMVAQLMRTHGAPFHEAGADFDILEGAVREVTR